MPVKVHLSGHLGNYTGRKVDIEIAKAGTVVEVLRSLCEMFPLVHDRILDEHERTRPYVNVFVNAENIRDLQDTQTMVQDGDEMYILPSVAGGQKQ